MSKKTTTYAFVEILSEPELQTLPAGTPVLNFQGLTVDALDDNVVMRYSMFGNRANTCYGRYHQGDIVYCRGYLNAPKVIERDDGSVHAVQSISLLGIYISEPNLEDT